MHIDKDLLQACIKRDRRAQYELYKLCYSILLSVCSRYEKNKEDAESLLNQGFLKVLRNLEKYNEKAPFEAWIRRIMINTIIDEYRKNKKQLATIEYADFQEESAHVGSVDFNEADKAFDATELENLLKQLPTVSHKVFNLHVIDGYSHKEIGAMLNISDGTSKWHVAYARKKLKEMIAKTMGAIHTVLL